MKHTLTILVFLCLAVGTAQAQMWFADGTRWVTNLGSMSGYSTTITKIMGDTVMGDKVMRKSDIQSEYALYPIAQGLEADTSYFYGAGNYYWEQNDSIFMRDDANSITLLFDFSAMVGDTMHFGQNFDEQPIFIILDSITTVYKVGKERRMQYWHYISPDTVSLCSSVKFNILEGLGLISHEVTYSYAPDEPYVIFGGARSPRAVISQCYIMDAGISNINCYHDGSVAADTSAWGSPCQDTIISNVPKPILLSGMTITPNPATSTAVIQWQQPVSGTLVVADFSGREVARPPLHNATSHALDCAAWPQGVYVVRVLANEGSYAAKLVVAR